MPTDNLRTHLDALRAISPMPSDEVLETDTELVDRYDELLRAIKAESDDASAPEVVRTLVYSFGLGDGFGTYWTNLHLIEKLANDETYRLIQQAAVEGPPGVRKWSCLLLGRRQDPGDVPFLISCLHDPEVEVLVQALRSLKMIARTHHIPEAIPYVKESLLHPQGKVSEAAAETLEALEHLRE